MVNERTFGYCVVVMFGDPAQLPHVMANSMWTDAHTINELTRWNLHIELETVVELTENKRLDVTDPDVVVFDKFLDKSRDGENTEEAWNILRGKCSLLAIGLDAWKNKVSNDNNVTHSCFTKKTSQ